MITILNSMYQPKPIKQKVHARGAHCNKIIIKPVVKIVPVNTQQKRHKLTHELTTNIR